MLESLAAPRVVLSVFPLGRRRPVQCAVDSVSYPGVPFLLALSRFLSISLLRKPGGLILGLLDIAVFVLVGFVGSGSLLPSTACPEWGAEGGFHVLSGRRGRAMLQDDSFSTERWLCATCADMVVLVQKPNSGKQMIAADRAL